MIRILHCIDPDSLGDTDGMNVAASLECLRALIERDLASHYCSGGFDVSVIVSGHTHASTTVCGPMPAIDGIATHVKHVVEKAFGHSGLWVVEAGATVPAQKVIS